MPAVSVVQLGRLAPIHGRPDDGLERRSLFDAPPEFLQLAEPILRLVAGDQAGVDRADRRADHPIGLDAGLVQRLVDAGLVGAERAAALQDEDDLAALRLKLFRFVC